MVCAKAVEGLFSVLITGRVTYSTITPNSPTLNVSMGDSMSLSFLADSEAIVRDVPGQGIVTDGIAPYPLCAEDFALTFSSGLKLYLGPPPVDLLGVVGAFYFSLMKGRPIHDGMFVAGVPDSPTLGVPLQLHGEPYKEKYSGVFKLSYERGTVPDLAAAAAYGTYTTKNLREKASELKIVRDWAQNTILKISLDKVVIGPAKGAKK